MNAQTVSTLQVSQPSDGIVADCLLPAGDVLTSLSQCLRQIDAVQCRADRSRPGTTIEMFCATNDSVELLGSQPQDTTDGFFHRWTRHRFMQRDMCPAITAPIRCCVAASEFLVEQTAWDWVHIPPVDRFDVPECPVASKLIDVLVRQGHDMRTGTLPYDIQPCSLQVVDKLVVDMRNVGNRRCEP